MVVVVLLDYFFDALVRHENLKGKHEGVEDAKNKEIPS
jgi:hypothetical protein